MSKRLTVHRDQCPIYDIVIEKSFVLLKQELESFAMQSRKLCIVTDTNVSSLYGQELIELLGTSCKYITLFVFDAGEEHKTLETVSKLYEYLIEHKFDRKDMLVALGGGVVGDLTGYAAATYLRGIDFIQIPTTLLSQVDSSIGGKTGVDFKQYKNMIGAFYQPKLVYMNLNTLASLDDRIFLSGMGEILKHGLIKDKDYFYRILKKRNLVMSRDFHTLEDMIYDSCMIKRGLVELDPKEMGERALLNFGHTIGHSVEKLMGFQLFHGECVALGMIAGGAMSMECNHISKEDYEGICNAMQYFHLPTKLKELDPIEVLNTTKLDKKMDAGQIKFIMLEKIGQAYINKTIDDKLLLKGIDAIIG